MQTKVCFFQKKKKKVKIRRVVNRNLFVVQDSVSIKSKEKRKEKKRKNRKTQIKPKFRS